MIEEGVLALDVNKNYIINPDTISISDTIEEAASMYKFYPSILLINDKILNQEKLLFNPISKVDVE